MGKSSKFDEVDLLTQEEIDERKKKKEEKHRRQRKILSYTLKLKHISPLTENQEKVFHEYFNRQNILMYGCAGTGKTYVGLYLALNDLVRGDVKNIVIVRSAVTSRDVGFLPGTLQEKMALYELPYKEMVGDLCQLPNAYEMLKSKDALEFMSTSFMRGLTFDDSVIIIDEVQNLTEHEISSVLTRVGKNSKVIICGDFRQNDLSINFKKQVSGLDKLLEVCRRMKSFSLIEFQLGDIVRSGFVKEYIIARYLNED